jgi:hypothetical protein
MIKLTHEREITPYVWVHRGSLRLSEVQGNVENQSSTSLRA